MATSLSDIAIQNGNILIQGYAPLFQSISLDVDFGIVLACACDLQYPFIDNILLYRKEGRITISMNNETLFIIEAKSIILNYTGTPPS